MRVLVYEFVTGGGLAGEAVPAALVREGLAMRDALVSDLQAAGSHAVVAAVDARFPLRAPAGVDVVTIEERSGVDALVAAVDAVWLIAPESHGWLARAAAYVERRGGTLLGPGSNAISRAADKAALPRRLEGLVKHPTTRVVPAPADRDAVQTAALEVGYPVVVKPRWGAGSIGVSLAPDPSRLAGAVDAAWLAGGGEALVVQRYVEGVAASVSLVADGSRAVAVSVNGQSVEARGGRHFAYRGGVTPLDHPLAARAADAALRTCEALPGLRGFIGVDVVLTDREAVVIEVNPRLTTAYLGGRAAIAANIAAMALDACRGVLPRVPAAHRSVRFTAGGVVVSARKLEGSRDTPAVLYART
jgi:predicted ATP-grasp superfamily ATP-dependent carboligase